MKIENRFPFSKIRHDEDHDGHLVVSLTAPATDWQARRSGVAIAAVVDVSGSMAGGKLEYAKRTLLKMVDHLQPGDWFSVVTFSDGVRVPYPPVEVTHTVKEKLKAEIGKIHVEGNTNLSGGMLEGLKQLEQLDLPDGVRRRVILLTDGQANAGVATTRAALVKLLEKNTGRCSLSAFGYGVGADQDMLTDLSKKGEGNYAFIADPEGALTAFASELGGLLSAYAQNIVVEVAPHNGHEIVKVLSDVDAEDKGGKIKIKLPELLSEESRHLVVQVKLDKQPKAFPRESSVFDVTISYETLQDGKTSKRTEETKAKIHFCKPGEEQKTADKEVDQLVALAQMVQTQLEAEAQADAGNYGNAAYMLNSLSADFASRGHGGYATYTSGTAGMTANSRIYGASKGVLSSRKRAATRAVGTQGLVDKETEALYSASGITCSNSAQTATVDSFTGGTTVGAGGIGSLTVAPSLASIAAQVGGVGGSFTITGTSGSSGASGSAVPSVPSVPTKAVAAKKGRSKSKRW